MFAVVDLSGLAVQFRVMRISVTDAQGQLPELVRRAEAGDEVILTRDGNTAVRLVPVKMVADIEARRRLVKEIQESAAKKLADGLVEALPSAARSQDFLYDEDGLPG